MLGQSVSRARALPPRIGPPWRRESPGSPSSDWPSLAKGEPGLSLLGLALPGEGRARALPPRIGPPWRRAGAASLPSRTQQRLTTLGLPSVPNSSPKTSLTGVESLPRCHPLRPLCLQHLQEKYPRPDQLRGLPGGAVDGVRGTTQEKLQWIFGLYDVNNDGLITKTEMVDVVTAIYEMMGRSTEPQEERRPPRSTEKIFHLIDTNQDGAITIEELAEWVSRDDTIIQSLSMMDTVLFTRRDRGADGAPPPTRPSLSQP
ncbi:putative Kv channel-interacting protein [Penaeus vannamei]|uniref:Putative Kv channel-interacting protein n=1 Tax=Penaeus vannamei TaxID=6689 RepID=A0A3R7Q343_PENVA|nr:putative Kv channel-interacting protein [Penaeus vannamei]